MTHDGDEYSEVKRDRSNCSDCNLVESFYLCVVKGFPK